MFLIELITFLFAIALLHNISMSDELVFFTWREMKGRGTGYVLKLLAEAIYQTLYLEVIVMPPCYILAFALDNLEGTRRVNVLWEERVRDSGVLYINLKTKNTVDVRRAQNSAQAAIRLLSNFEVLHLRVSLKQTVMGVFGCEVNTRKVCVPPAS